MFPIFFSTQFILLNTVLMTTSSVCGKNELGNWYNILLTIFWRVFLHKRIIIFCHGRYLRIPRIYFRIFTSYGLEHKSTWVVFFSEFDVDIHFCIAPPKSTIFWLFLDFFRFFSSNQPQKGFERDKKFSFLKICHIFPFYLGH